MAVLRSFRVIFGSVRQHFREVEKTCGVSGSQLWILQEVSRNGGIGVSDLASRLAIHQSTCSQLVDKLVRSGHIVKRRSSVVVALRAATSDPWQPEFVHALKLADVNAQFCSVVCLPFASTHGIALKE